MSQIKISFDDFILSLNAEQADFVQDLHNWMIENGCKVGYFEEKKTGLLGSYKHTKSKKSIVNLLLKSHGLLVRIYGENIGEYTNFLNNMPEELTKSLRASGDCKRLTINGCSPKCIGYDFSVQGEHFQKCRYGCFEFLVTDKSRDYIKEFVQNEAQARSA